MDNREYVQPKFHKPGLKVYKHGPCSNGKSYIVWVDGDKDVINSFNITDQLSVQVGTIELTEYERLDQKDAEIEKLKASLGKAKYIVGSIGLNTSCQMQSVIESFIEELGEE